MSDNLQMSDETYAPEEVSRSEVTLVTDIMLAMVKTSKGLRMYQSNNPVLEKFFQELSEKSYSMLRQYKQYRLDVDRFELKYRGHKVYENSDPKESMAFRMYSDGIRSVTFREGTEEWELKEFLEIVNMSSSASVDDDIVTQLWDRALPHFSYTLEDDYHDMDGLNDEQLSPPATSIFPPALLHSPSSLAAGIQPFPEQILLLSEADISSLQSLVDAEEQFRPLEATARILSAIISGTVEDGLFLKFLDLYLRFAENLFISGESRGALKMFVFLHRRTTSAEAAESRKRELLPALDRFWSADALKGFARNIDMTKDISFDELKAILQMIGRTTPSALCELLGLVESKKERKLVLDITTDFARENPRILLPFLKDPRWYLVRNMVCIFSELRNTEFLDKMVPLITHKEMRVRKEILRYLLTVPDQKAKLYIMKFLRDEAYTMRIMAVQLMGRARLGIALGPLMDFAASEIFEEMELPVKIAVYEAIAEIGPEKSLPVFRTMLTKKFHFQRAREKEAVICAAAALQKIPGEESLKMLREALKSKTKEHHEVLNKAIDNLARSRSADVTPRQER